MQCHLKSVVKDFLQSSSISETPLQSNTIVAQIELLARAVLWLTGKISRERIPSRLRRLGERRKPRPPTTNFLVLELPERFCRDFEASIGDIQDLAKKMQGQTVLRKLYSRLVRMSPFPQWSQRL